MSAANPASDQQLLDAYVRQHSQDAFRILVERHAHWVFAAAFRQLRDRHLAEDATQVVFVLLHRRSRAMRSQSKLSGWLFTTLQYTIRNIRRAQIARELRERRAALRQPAAVDPPSPECLSHDLDSAVAHLSSTDRTAILLHFYQDLSFEQLAGALGISEPAARKRVTRAVQSLRLRLGSPVAPAALSLAAAHGMDQSPSLLAQTVIQTVATAKAAGALTPAVAATLKGVSILMALTKVQTTALIVVPLLLLAAASTYVATTASRSPAPHPSASTLPLPATPDASQPPPSLTEIIDNPTYLAWSACKPGSSVTFKMIMMVDSRSVGIEHTITQKLLRSTPDSAIIQISNSLTTDLTELTIPSTIERGAAGMSPSTSKPITRTLGKESLVIKGQPVETTTYNFTTQQPRPDGTAFPSETKTWFAPGIPGGLVQEQMTIHSNQLWSATTTLLDYSLAN